MRPGERRGRLSLHKETLRVLQDTELRAAVGGAATLMCHIETAIYTVCGFDPPPWVSTSPPTHLCQ